jgi:hypothetical protein
VKLVAPASPRYAPWLQLGVGTYRLDRNLDEQRPEGTYSWVEGGSGNSSIVPGGYVEVGLDVRAASPLVFGLTATFHHVWSRDEGWSGNDLPNFSAFTMGTRVLLEWE